MTSLPTSSIPSAAAVQPRTPPLALQGVRILSLALNLPGPAALMRCQELGAACLKFEPPQGDPMRLYSEAAYDAMHRSIDVRCVNLKTPEGMAALHEELARTDVLLTSFRPAALERLGIAWPALQASYPRLSQVAIVGSPGADADTPGHDLTYVAQTGLVPGFDLPATLFADMGGSLTASQAILQAVLVQRQPTGPWDGTFTEVALSDAAEYLALPRQWGLTSAASWIGGAHAGYQVYACQDGRVALAALEPHFSAALCAVVGIAYVSVETMLCSVTRAQIAAFLLTQSRQQLDALANTHDIPLHTLA